MTQLTKDQFNRAGNFILEMARALEKARFSFHFEDGKAAEVLRQLSVFQNEDGGFGRCLEPDFRLSSSSPMATSIAFQIFNEIGIEKNDRMVVSAVEYLWRTFDEKRSFWPQVPKEIELVPRAMWWNYNELPEGEIPPEQWGNPTIEIVGWLLKYSQPNDMLINLKSITIRNILGLSDEMEMHDFLCSLRFLENLNGEDAEKVKEKLLRVAQKILSRDEKNWAGYGLRPHWVIKSPDSPLYTEFRSVLPRAFAF